jgi:DNA-binding LacI/PurR family transcriptional regulator
VGKTPDPGSAKPTLATVAAAVGVSAMTVSNAYSRPGKLSAELRDRILAAADRLGYPGPDPTARSLRRGQAGALGVVLGESLQYAFGDPGAVQFLQGLAGACADAGAGLYLLPATGTAADEDLARAAAVDAFILFGLPDDHPLAAACVRRGLPVLTSGGPELPGCTFVGIDDRAAARAAAGCLLSLGHHHLAVISFPLGTRRHPAGPADAARQRQATFRIARQRLAGYRDACAAAGRDWPGVPVYEVPGNTRSAGREAARSLLRAAPHTTAVLAMSDELALGVLDAAAGLGRSVPHDLSVIGFDDTASAATAPVPLTTVRQSLRNQGQTLGRLALTSSAQPVTQIQPWNLIDRSSTARPLTH